MKIKSMFCLLSMIMVAMLSVICVSCGNDDNDDSVVNNSIVGTWRLNDEEGYQQYIFKKDGNGFYEDWGYDNGRTILYDRMAITYVYKTNDKAHVIVEDDGDVFEYEVVALTSSKLVLRENDEIETYERQ